MAKRFTDSNIWDHAWYRKLAPKLKLAFNYIKDKCDHAGIWTADFEAMSFNVGEPISKQEFETAFSSKVDLLDDDKYFIPSFIAFQYGHLNPENRVHRSVILRLEKLAPSKPLISPFQGAKDKDKDKEQDKDKDSLGGVGEKFAPHRPEKISTPQVSELVSLWGETLKHFKIKKDPRLDEIHIASMASRHGFEKSKLAIVGARHEQPTKTFDPAKHISVFRISDLTTFEKLVNLGAQEQTEKPEDFKIENWIPPEERNK